MKKKIMAVAMAVAVATTATPVLSADAANKVTIAKNVYVKKGASKTITVKNAKKAATWKTSNKKVVSIKKTTAKKVTVKGVKVGTAVITATVGKQKVKCKVHVGATKLTVSNKKKNATVGTKFVVTANMKNGTGDKVTFTSSKKAVATVKKTTAKKATVTAKKAGKTVLKATTKSGCVVKWTLTVSAKKPAVTATPVVTTTPAVTSEPAVTTEPAVTATPVVTTTPAVTTEPAVTATPVTTPAVTATPEVTTEPAVTTTPAVTGATITVVVKDAAGKVVTDAAVSVTGGSVSGAAVEVKEKDGKATAEVENGLYLVTAKKNDFVATDAVVVAGEDVEIVIVLK